MINLSEMMIYSLCSGNLMARINIHGAELQHLSFKDGGSSVLWEASEPWKRTSPWLFPIIGRLVHESYRWQNQDYFLNQHGFLRDVDFKVEFVNQSELLLSFSHEQLNDELRLKYPFAFSIKIHFYFVKENFKIKVTVKNESSQQLMPFSFGWHPAFKVQSQNEMVLLKTLDSSTNQNSVIFHKLNEQGYIDSSMAHDGYKTTSWSVKNLEQIERAEILVGQTFQAYTFSDVKVAFEPPCDQIAVWSRESSKFLCVEPWWGGGLYNVKDGHNPFALQLEPLATQDFEFSLSLI